LATTHDRNLKQLLKDAWEEQMKIKKVTDDASNKYYKLVQ